MKRRKDGRYSRDIVIDGKRHVFYSSEPTERAAVRDIERQMLRFTEARDAGPLFSEVAEEYIKSVDGKIAETTYAGYNAAINQTSDYFKGERIRALTAKDIDSYLRHMVRQERAGKTIRNHLDAIRHVYEYAAEHYSIPNVAATVKAPRGKASKVREALTDAEQEIVLQSADAPFGLFAILLLYTGLRRGELFGLRWSDFDFESGFITVSRSITYAANSTPILKEPKTAAGVRRVLILAPVVRLIKPLYDAAKNKDEYVLTGEKPRGQSWYRRRWDKYLEATGLNVTQHQFRHTYATILYEAGVDELAAQTLMGHKDISTTHKIYTHLRDKHMTENLDKLKSFIG